MRTLTGISVTPLSGVGTVQWYDPAVELPETTDSEAAGPESELAAFEHARDVAREELTAERERTAKRIGEAEAEVFEAHLEFLDDPQITEDVTAAVDEGSTATQAVAETFDSYVEQFEGMEGRFAERAADLRDLRDRLLRILTDSEHTDLSTLPEGTVLVAEDLTPSDTARLDPDAVVGLATVGGGRTSHSAIFARSLAIPAVVDIGNALFDVDDGTTVLVDGEAGAVVIDPDTGHDQAATATVEIKPDPVSTVDGRAIEVAANVGTIEELTPAVERGADGIGLFRTEFLFLDRETPPTEDEQYETYRAALEAFPDSRVIVRTLDVGGDKPISYLDLPDEENPFLGARGIRLSLEENTALFEAQLRALLRAAADGAGDLGVMFPMVTTVAELDRVLELVASVDNDLEREDVTHAVPELGVMVETPAAVFCAHELAERVEFLSIGTNDLTQYVMAASRGTETVTDLHDPLYPAVLRAIDRTVREGHRSDAWVGVCGEMAGEPELMTLLVGLGVDELSMSAVTIPSVKAAVAGIDSEAARALARAVLTAETRAAIRDRLQLG
ncbi:phosphoenolpyruvate--protein phosphotransferase [Halocatena salina]|uniref:Phosphoenolpyruvate-protein phosphotransferase n=1 Tax=Halocatena salina TaxID=2934340 RepID=A0A8U0A732_9EURY|nr:phosphoenolpyruvate--protein phosphotransferase [Halocatena salina]UPM44814.1 phosphoenolpyruvate--protein phosphotransferase [Halocatena salina]